VRARWAESWLAGAAAVVAALAPALGGCSVYCRGLHNVTPGACSKYTDHDDDGGDGSVHGGVVTGEQPTDGTAPSRQVSETVDAQGFALTRMPPEQLSNNIMSALDYGPELRDDDNETGQTLDYLVLGYGVPLGGIDFLSAQRRDPTTKAQTLLIARLVAWEIAQAAVWKEHELDPGDRVVFTRCDLKTDAPGGDAESEQRWAMQLEELYYRFYARAPTDAERAAVRKAFLVSMQHEGYPPSAWVIVLYALLASEEFWHV
jgi:hypothetical protein